MGTEQNETKMKSITALVVDDEAMQTELMSDILMASGVKKVITARNGEAAVRLFRQEKPDIVFSDIIMVKISGLKLLRRIKEINSETPVILISGFHEYRKILENSDPKPDNFLEKPISVAKFKKIIWNYFPHLRGM